LWVALMGLARFVALGSGECCVLRVSGGDWREPR